MILKSKIKKTLLFIIGTFITLLVMLSGFAYLSKDKLIGWISSELDDQLATEIYINDISVSVFKSFPNIAINLGDIYVRSVPGYLTTEFKKNTDTLLYADNVAIEFNTFKLFKGIYEINLVKLESGRVNLYTDKMGNVNYHLWISKVKSDSDNNINLAFHNVLFQNMDIAIDDHSKNIELLILNESLKIDFVQAEEKTTFSVFTQSKILNFRTENYPISTLNLKGGMIIVSDENRVNFNSRDLIIEEVPMKFSGYYDKGGNQNTSFSMEGTGLSIKKLGKSLGYNIPLKGTYNYDGKLSFDLKVTGPLNSAKDVKIEGNYSLSEGQLTKSNIRVRFREIEANGKFNFTGKLKGSFSVDQVKGELNDSPFMGSYRMSRYQIMSHSISIKGSIKPDLIEELVDTKGMGYSGDQIDFVLSVPTITSYAMESSDWLTNLKPEGFVTAKNISIINSDGSKFMSGMNGDLFLSENKISGKDFHFIYDEADMRFSGTLIHLFEYFDEAKFPLEIRGNLDIDTYKIESNSEPEKFKFPDNINFFGTLNINSLIYNDLFVNQMKSKCTLNQNKLFINDLEAKCFNGVIQGSGTFQQISTDLFELNTQLTLNGLNITNLFQSFNNFGQEEIKSDNISGTLESKVSFQGMLDGYLDFQLESIKVSSEVNLKNGILKDVTMLYSLSDYIDIEELKQIHFSEISNYILIENEVIKIPEMNVESSAINLLVAGEHNFENQYSYHITVSLSEILGKKIKKKRESEFSFESTDEKPKWMINLLVVGQGEDCEVSRDKSRSKSMRRDLLEKEREDVKAIFNREFSTDSNRFIPNDTNESKGQNIFIWDESTVLVNDTLTKKPKTKTDDNSYKVLWDDK